MDLQSLTANLNGALHEFPYIKVGDSGIVNRDPEKNLFIVTVLFNPFDFESHKKKYRAFEQYVRWSGAHLTTVEIAYADRPFEHTQEGNPDHVQLRTTDVLWHKERGLNLGIQHVMKKYPSAKYIGWFDDDVRLANPHWVEDTIKALHHYCVIQPFSQAVNLNPLFEEQWNCLGRIKHFIKHRGFHQKPEKPLAYTAGGHPGLAWAARRETLEQLGGLIDMGVTGSGDTYMANALMGDVIFNSKPGMSDGFKKMLIIWQKRCDQYVKKNIGFVPGLIMHYWHGKSGVRGYDKRWDIACFHKFDPYEDIELAPNGLYRWTGNKPELAHDLRLSSMNRNEDSIDE